MQALAAAVQSRQCNSGASSTHLLRRKFVGARHRRAQPKVPSAHRRPVCSSSHPPTADQYAQAAIPPPPAQSRMCASPPCPRHPSPAPRSAPAWNRRVQKRSVEVMPSGSSGGGSSGSGSSSGGSSAICGSRQQQAQAQRSRGSQRAQSAPSDSCLQVLQAGTLLLDAQQVLLAELGAGLGGRGLRGWLAGSGSSRVGGSSSSRVGSRQRHGGKAWQQHHRSTLRPSPPGKHAPQRIHSN